MGEKGNSQLSSISAHTEMAAVYKTKVDELEEGIASTRSVCYNTAGEEQQPPSQITPSGQSPPGTSLFSYSREGSPAGEQGVRHCHSLTSPKCPRLVGGPQNHPEE